MQLYIQYILKHTQNLIETQVCQKHITFETRSLRLLRQIIMSSYKSDKISSALVLKPVHLVQFLFAYL